MDGLPQDDDAEVDRIIALAHRHLGMDVAFISQFRAGKQVFLATAGDADSFGIEVNDGPPLDSTFCQRLVRNIIPPVIPDTRGNAVVAELPVTREKNIGAYVGVPLTFSDGEVYGTFCCLSHNPDPALNERDARFMAMLADVLATRLEGADQRRRQRDEIVSIIECGTFNIALQPVVSLFTGALVGAEALTRFEAGMGPPDLVFNQAHELGIGPELEAAAFRHSRGIAGQLAGGAYLAMNLSPAALVDPSVRAALDLVDNPRKCVLELTEHVSVDGYAALVEALAPLRAKGFRLAVDDVGAGYASFHHVLELRPDIIKIDRSLVSGSGRDGARRRIITSIVLLGMDLAAAVVAEGVEDHDDLRTVAELGVDAAQGYLLAQPTTDRSAIALWSEGWDLALMGERITQADGRKALGLALRNLRGSRRQVDVLKAVNEALMAAGHSERVSQGQYSAYEHGRERPLPVRLAAIEAVFELEAGKLTAILGGGFAGGAVPATAMAGRVAGGAPRDERSRSGSHRS